MTGMFSTLRGQPRGYILLLFLALLTPATQAADPVWDVVAVRDATGVLAFCRAEKKDNDSDLTLAIALSPKKEVNIGIKVPQAGFTRGEGYDVILSIDDLWRKKVTAETALEELLLVRLGAAADFLAAFNKGKELRLAGDMDAAAFPLSGSSAALEKLEECVGSDTTEAQKASNGALPPGLAALLQAAELNVVQVPLPDVPGRAVDYAWTTIVDGQQIDGGFVERTVGNDALTKLAGDRIAGYEKQCAGKAVTQKGKTELHNGVEMMGASITCNAGADSEAGAFLFYLTDTHIFATVIHRAPATKLKAAQTARDAVAGVVKRLAIEDGKETKQ